MVSLWSCRSGLFLPLPSTHELGSPPATREKARPVVFPTRGFPEFLRFALSRNRIRLPDCRNVAKDERRLSGGNPPEFRAPAAHGKLLRRAGSPRRPSLRARRDFPE